ncbi:MAG: hypothetical protein WCC64_02175 [Aliidongia sp.]
MARHQCHVQLMFRQRRLDVAFVHLDDRQHDLRMPFAPVGQQAADRFADRRHPDAQADMADPTCPVLKPRTLDCVQLGEGAPDMRHDCPTAGGQADTRVSTLEERHAKVVPVRPRPPSAGLSDLV